MVEDVVAEYPQDDDVRLAELRKMTDWVVGKVASELFCDAVGFLISGPAFLLSLHEVTTWGLSEAIQGMWSGTHPSPRFRMWCLSELIGASSFRVEIAKLFENLDGEKLREMAGYFATIPTDHSGDRVSFSTFHAPMDDRLVVESAIGNHLSDLKLALGVFLKRCWGEFVPLVENAKNFPPVSAEDVYKLLSRLEKDILPNMVPDGTLLSKPASFAAILNAAAIYRLHILRASEKAASTRDVYREVQKIERLTAKALEVSFVQRDFNAWEAKAKKKNTAGGAL